MRNYGGAVLTALHAQHKNSKEISRLIQQRILEAYLRGGKSEEWFDCFWHSMAILEAQKCREKIEERNLQMIFSINVKTCKSVTVSVRK